MSKSLTVLMIEDTEDDAMLTLRSLRQGGFDPAWRRVDTAAGLIDALDSGRWDVVLSDHHMPAFSSTEALAIVRKRGLDVPFILVSGSIGEEAAVNAMKAGAQDYVPKDHLVRLPAAIERELCDADERRARRHAEAKIHQLAYYDELTLLPNRRLLGDRLATLCATHAAEGAQLAVLTLKLDNLREVRNTLGHQTSERVLAETAERLGRNVRAPNFGARIGTNQFAVVLPNTGSAAAVVFARELQQSIEEPIAIGAMEIGAEPLIGLAIHPDDGDCGELLLQHADVALSLARESSTRVSAYSRDRDPYKPERLALAAELRRAIETGQLLLHYQPKVHLASGALTDVEALVRWKHPALGMIPPDRFIPFAEQSGLINRVTRWVLGEALHQAAVWQAAGNDLRIAVNLSAKNLHSPELIDFVLDRVTATDVAPDRIILEVTESAVMTDEARVAQMLQRVHDHGVEISIDDFGTGYSSLSNLRRLPVSEIKIDRSFVTSLADVDEDRIIVSSIVELGHNLGLQVVAEGVETATAWAALGAFGCDLAQGYYLSRPLPATELQRFAGEFIAPPLSTPDQPLQL